MTREPWFTFDRYAEGAGRSINAKGCLAFALAGMWLLFSAAIGMWLILRWQNPMALVVMFGMAVPGLAVFAYFVATRSTKS